MLPHDVLPPEPREYDPLDDTWWWPGPVEAEHPPADLDEYGQARRQHEEYPERLLALADYYDAEARRQYDDAA